MVLQSRLWAGRTLSTLMSAILGFGELGGEEEIRVKIRRVKKGRSFKRVLKSEDLAKIPLAEEGVGGAMHTHTHIWELLEKNICSNTLLSKSAKKSPNKCRKRKNL